MAEKKKSTKATKKSTKKPAKKTTKKTSKTTKKSTKAKKKSKNDAFEDSSIVIVEDNLEIDQEKVNEERRAYLEEARSQEAFD